MYTYHKLFLQMISIVIVFAWIDVPASNLVTVDAIVCLVSDESRPIIFGQKRAVCLLPGLILNIRRSCVL
jgi:hypothetical protein